MSFSDTVQELTDLIDSIKADVLTIHQELLKYETLNDSDYLQLYALMTRLQINRNSANTINDIIDTLDLHEL